MELGYTLMSEEHGPRELVDIAQAAEAGGFSFLVASDHFHPWVKEQQHSPHAWTMLCAVAQATERVLLQTFVTCPFLRYHPAIVAQQAATLALLSEGRFTLSVGAGERLNEHVVGRGWPSVSVRHEMLREAIEIIRLLWRGGYQSYRGSHLALEDARVFDLPDEVIDLHVAASGPASLAIAAELGDGLVATTPDRQLVDGFREQRGEHCPVTGQLPVAWATSEQAGLEVAHRQFRWSALGWKVQAELPNPLNFDTASSTVRPDDLASTIPHGPDPAPYVEAVQQWADAGFDRLALLQVGDDQDGFFEFWRSSLQPALRDAGLHPPT